MDSTVEVLGENKVKLSVSVPEKEFDEALNAAFTKIAQEVRIPGFRPGKAPRKVLEARLGTDFARDEALRDSLPDYYAQALRTHDVDAIAVPEIEVTAGQDTGDVEFEATVEVRPEITVTGYSELEIEIEYAAVDDDAIERHVDQLRERFGDLVDSDDPLVDGAYANLDITGRHDGEEVDGLSVTEFLYEVGSELVVPELDAELRGKNPGDILKFSAELPERFGERAGDEVEFTVVVKDAKRKVLPDLTDEWVGEASEFDTVDELRGDIRQRLEMVTAAQARRQAQEKILDALADLVEIAPPAALVDSETNRRVHDLAHRLEHQGMNLEQYFEATGNDPEEFVSQVREGATRAVLADLALRSVIVQESIAPTDDEVTEQIARLADELNEKVERIQERMESEGGSQAIRSELARAKALEFLVDSSRVVDEDGEVVDVTVPEPAVVTGESAGSDKDDNQTSDTDSE